MCRKEQHEHYSKSCFCFQHKIGLMQHKEDVFHLCVNYCFKKSLEKYSVWFLFCLCSRGILCTLAYLLASGLCMIKLKSGQCPSAELSKLFSICGASHIRCICFCSLSLSVRFWISPWFFSSRLLSLVKVNCCPHHLPGCSCPAQEWKHLCLSRKQTHAGKPRKWTPIAKRMGVCLSDI